MIWHDQARLIQNVQDYIEICSSQYNFDHGEVASTNNVIEGPENNVVRTLLGIYWDPSTDLWSPNSEWNITAKSRGCYRDKSLSEMTDEDLQQIEILLRQAAALTSRWKEPISDPQIRSDVIKLLGHISDTPIVPQPRAVIPAGHFLQKLNASGDGSKSSASNTFCQPAQQILQRRLAT